MESSALLPGLQPNSLIYPSRQPRILSLFPSSSSSASSERKLLFFSPYLKLQRQSLVSGCNAAQQRASFLRQDATLSDTYSDAAELADLDWDNLGFGFLPTDYMYSMKCDRGGNFSNGELQRFGNIELTPSAGVLNYGQGLFEGLKAYRKHDDNILLFRPEENALRMRMGAERMCMPAPTVDQFVEAVKATVLANKRWIPPTGKGSLYIRPLLMGTGAVLGLAPSPEYTFLIYVSPVGNYFKEGVAPISLVVEHELHRATPGGTGGVKTIGNYAAVLKAQSAAKTKGYSDVLYLDCVHKKYLEEVSSCNIFVVKGNVISTPAIKGTILPGITRKSIIDVARSQGFQVEERLVEVDELLDADEVFCTGTAVVISPVGSITYRGQRVSYVEGGFGPVSQQLYSTLTSLQMGLIEDKMNWTVKLSWEIAMGDKSEGISEDFYIPDYLLVPGSKATKATHVPACPVIVFINSKSGGQLGSQLLVTYRSVLNKNQVFDLGENAPDKVLHQLYVTLEVMKSSGDHLANEVQKKLRIIVAGGDGTASWLLGVVSDLKLPKPPPVATVPLGTGNNLPFSFGWGKKNPGTDKESVQLFLNQVRAAKEMKIDSWHLIMRMKAPKEGSCDPIAPLELPHSLHAFHRVSKSDRLNMEGYDAFRGGFWNYFSMGMDAQVSYAFHSERKLHPEKFRNQLSNQSNYLKLVCTQGWFCTSLFHPSSRNVAQLAKVKIMKRHGKWEDLLVPRSIRSIVCLNLPSFSGGLNPWGKPDPKKRRERDLTPPYVDDGLLEIVGFRNAWHGLVLLTPNGHGTRLAQTNRIHFEFHKGAAEHTFMRIDGEPWKQPLPVDDDTVTIEISHAGQVTMLATPSCQSRSVYDPSSPVCSSNDDENSSEEDDLTDDWEERRKFGAAETFRLPDGLEISQLS